MGRGAAAAVTEHPLFVPYEGEAVAAVLTVPDGPPRGVVVLLQGLGPSTRSHRHRLWPRTARRLAERGIATVRLDYPGIGDSTGDPVPSGVWDVPVEQARAVTRLALGLLGVEAWGFAGNCWGVRTGMRLAAALPGCRAAVIMHLEDLFDATRVLFDSEEPNAATVTARRARRRLGGVLPWLRPVVHRVRSFRAARRPWPELIVELVRSTPLLLLICAPAADRARRVLAGLSGRSTQPVELGWIEVEAGFARMSPEAQEGLIAALVDWFDRQLPERTGKGQPAPEAETVVA
jgi:pimeloyl-ACP methyl ester carboxylesterase